MKYGNETYFSDAITFILQKFLTVLPCSDVFPNRYSLNGNWLCSTPTARPCNAPEQLTPFLGHNNFHLSVKGLGKDLFTQKQKHQNDQFITAIQSRNPLSSYFGNTMALQNSSRPADARLLPAHTVKKIVTQVQERTFQSFHFVGKHYRAVLGVLVLFWIVKTIVDFLVRMYIAVRRFGCGWWILSAFYGLAFVLIHMPVRMFKTTTQLIKEDAEEKLPSRGNELAVHQPKTYKELREQFDEIVQQPPADPKHQTETVQAEDKPDDLTKPFLTITTETHKDKNH